MIKLYKYIVLFLYLNASLNSQNSWLQKANFSGSFRPSPVTFTISNKAYLGIGGSFGPAQFERDFWEYNPSTDTWTQKADVGTVGRIEAVGFAINGKGYIGLGRNFSLLSDFWEYNPNTNQWTQKNNFPSGNREFASSFVINNVAYIGAGHDGTNFVTDFWKYNDNNDTWTRIADFPSNPRYAGIAFAIKDKGYYGGGVETNTWVSFSDFWEYNPRNDIWTRKADQPSANVWGAGFVIGNKGYIGISFGQTVYEYDPSKNTWVQKADLTNLYRAYGIGFSIGNKGYMGMGTDNCCTNYMDFWEYTPGTTPSLDNTDIIKFTNQMATASASIVFNGNYTIEQQGFVWSTSPNPTINSYSGGGFSNSLIKGNNFLDTLNNLLPNTKYYFRAYASNSQGTSYGDEYSFTTLSNETVMENNGPNNGDGNGDGILDSEQDYVVSILNPYNNKYLTIVSLDNFTILNSEFVLQNESINYYPYNLFKFKINQSNAKVKIIYHGISNLSNHSFLKLNSSNRIFKFTNCTFGSEVINGKLVATATLNLTDGGPEDFDGVVNGVIVDPGGPAIIASNANIPTLTEWARYILLILIPLFLLKKQKKYL